MAGVLKLNRNLAEAAPRSTTPRLAGWKAQNLDPSYEACQEDLHGCAESDGFGHQNSQSKGHVLRQRSSQECINQQSADPSRVPSSARQSSRSQGQAKVPRPRSSQDGRCRPRGAATPSPTPRADETRRSIKSPLPLSETQASQSVPRKSSESTKQEEEPEDVDVWIHSEFYAMGGQKKKALQALSRDIESQGVSVHQVHEVQQILSGSSRVDVKLEYYRDHYHLSDPLQKTVQDDFMCIDPMTKQPIVNVSKLRYKGRDFMGLQQELHDDDDSRPQSRASGRTSPTTGRSSPPPRRSVMTPDIAASTLRDRASAQSARIERTLALGRDLDLRRRLERLEVLQQVMGRHSRAERERPWLKYLAVSSRTAVMMKCLVAFHCTKQTVSGKVRDISRSAVKPIVAWKGLNSRACALGLRHLHVLSKRQTDAIERIIAERRKRENHCQRSLGAFKAWTKLLRVAIFYTRVRRPLRKHFAIAMIKDFLDVTSEGFRLRVAVKRYMHSVRFVQRALQHQTRIFRIVREMILEKELWAMETRVLCEKVGIPAATCQAAIDAYMEANEVQVWREEVRALNVKRSKIWNGLEPPPPALPISSDYIRHRRLSVASSSILGDPSAKHVPTTPKEEPGRQKRPAFAQSGAAQVQGSEASGKWRRAKSMLHRSSTSSSVSSGEAISRHRRSVSGETNASEVISPLDALRLDTESRKEVARRLLVQNIDTWWGHYNSFMAAREESKKFFKVWIREVQTSAMFDVALTPEPPEVVPYPEMLDKILNPAELRLEIKHRVDERQQQLDQLAVAARQEGEKFKDDASDD